MVLYYTLVRLMVLYYALVRLMVLYYTLVRLAGVELLSLCRSIKKNIADLSQKISELASRPNGDNSQLMDQLSDELQVQQTQLKQTK